MVGGLWELKDKMTSNEIQARLNHLMGKEFSVLCTVRCVVVEYKKKKGIKEYCS